MTMDGRAKGIKPLLDQIVLEFIGVPETRVIPAAEEGGEDTEQTFIKTRAIIKAIGSGITEPGFVIGDWVVFDGSKVVAIDLEDPTEEGKILKYGICPLSAIFGVYEES